MKFGPVPSAEAAGGILAHSIAAGGVRLRKGTLLTAAHVATLRARGIDTVTIAQLDAGDIHEDAAAYRLAAAIVPDPAAQGIVPGAAATGRVNLKAQGSGIVQIDTSAIAAMNRIDPMLTLATLPNWHRVEAGQLIATVKVIAYGVPETALDQACAAVAGAMSVLPPVAGTATLIETQVGSDTPSDKGRRATAARLDRFGVSLTERVIVPHQTAPLADALAAASGDVVLILTASATSDIRDTAPAAVRAAGGEVDHFGMPVDPGNLLFIGALQGKPVIGLPGCARSPAMNGADWVLERILCGVSVTGADIADMGVGGLLKEIPQRGRPRENGA